MATYTVLIVEEAGVVRRSTRRVLADRGCRVLEAANAAEALSLLANPDTHVDLVLIGLIGTVGQPARRNEQIRIGSDQRARPVRNTLLPEDSAAEPAAVWALAR